jgi:transposase
MGWVGEEIFERMKIHFPRSRGKPLVDDRRVISGILHVLRNGLRWKDLPPIYGPHKTIYNRFVRWSRRGGFSKIFSALAASTGEGYWGLCPHACSATLPHLYLWGGEAVPSQGLCPRTPARAPGRTRGGLNSKLHAICDENGKPIKLLLIAGNVNDISMAKQLLGSISGAACLMADRSSHSEP